MTSSALGPRKGLTRIDLLALAGVVVFAFGMLAPALARTAALSARQQSAQNLKQLGQGLRTYHTTFGFFPSNGGAPPEVPTAPDVRTGFPTMDAYRWGYGDPKRTGRLQTGSYAYALLPFVGEEEAYRKKDHTRAVKGYYLPSRREARAQDVPKRDPIYKDWYYLDGGLGPWGRTDYAANDQVVRPGMGNVMSSAQIADGLAETVLAGEKAMDTRAVRAGVWYWDEPIVLGGSGGTGRKGKHLHRDSPKVLEDAADNWGSPDPAGAQFVFGDGHVRLIGYKIAPETMWAALTPAGGDDVELD